MHVTMPPIGEHALCFGYAWLSIDGCCVSVIMLWRRMCALLLWYLCCRRFLMICAGTAAAMEQIALGLKATSAEVHSAQITAVEMYTRLLACASDEHVHAADAANAAVGLVQPPSTPPARARAEAGTNPSPALSTARGPQSHQAPMPSVLPPDFARHCAAISAWGFNLKSLRRLLNGHLLMLCAEHMVGTADYFIPWLCRGKYFSAGMCAQLRATFHCCTTYCNNGRPHSL
jgi:hypothetical protein